MSQYRTSTLRQVLREADSGTLEDAWVYLRDTGEVRLESECLVLGEVEEMLEYAASLGFPQEGLDTASIEDCVAWAKAEQPSPSDELLLYAFRYYWVSVRRTRLDDGQLDQRAVLVGCQRCGSNSWTRLAGCVGKRSSTSFK
jgi:hypothetical protein